MDNLAFLNRGTTFDREELHVEIENHLIFDHIPVDMILTPYQLFLIDQEDDSIPIADLINILRRLDELALANGIFDF